MKCWSLALILVALCVIAIHQLAAQNPAAPAPAAAQPAVKEKTIMPADAPPRKTIVGSLMFPMWVPYPGAEKRCRELADFIDQMAKDANAKFGRSLDIAALPEVAVNGNMKGGAKDVSFPLEGTVLDVLGAAAKRNHCYVVVPMYWAEDAAKTKCYNICALLDRQGKVAGIYRKVHPVDSGKEDQLEGGCLPGKDFPVFQCDFGKLGMQICFDMQFDDGWEALAKKGAELVIWSTQSPGILSAQMRAYKNHYFVLSSTWRNNISLVDPTGERIAHSEKAPSVMVEEIDLEYVQLAWQPKLKNGQAFTEKYGKAAGFRYSEAEDGGIFWSNDANVPIGRMVRELGLELPGGSVERNRALQDKLRGGPPKTD